MKFLLSTLFYLVAFAGISQTSISGTISFYPNSALTVLGFNGIHTKRLGSVKTDSKGHFSFRTPYHGVIKLVMSNGGIELLKDQSADLRFSLTGKSSKYLHIAQGSSAILYKDYLTSQKTATSRLSSLKALQPLYQVEDPFRKAVESQLALNRKRIDDFNRKLKSTKDYASYYIPLRKDLDAISNVRNLGDLNALQTEYLNHLTKDGEDLELSGSIQNVVMTYLQTIKMELGKAYNQKKETAAAMDLLDKVDLETPRGQQLASFLMGFFKSTDNEAGQDSIVSRISCLTCHIDETLKRKVKSFQKFKIGAKAPDIVFPRRKNGVKSLYGIKSRYKLIIFWASWCPHCQVVVPKIGAIYPKLKKRGVEVISVSADFDPVAYGKARKKLPWPYDYVDYKKWETIPFLDYGVAATPTFVLLDARNIVLDKMSDFKKVLKETGNSAIHFE